MKILVFGAGVIGCNLAYDFQQAGKDVTLLARGEWGKQIEENGLQIKGHYSFYTKKSKIKVIHELKKDDIYDVIFVCMRYTQLNAVLDTLIKNKSKHIVLVGNNIRTEEFAKTLSDKNVMFGFVISAGYREKNRVVSIDLKKITIGGLKSSTSHEVFICEIFSDMKYKVVYEANMGDYLLSHAAFVVPVCLACYKVGGDLKKLKHNKAFINKIIDANIECYEAIERLGHELLPKGEEQYRSSRYHKMCYRFYKLMFSTSLGKLCVSDHAMHAVDEIGRLESELSEMIGESGIEAKNYDELRKYR